MILVDASHNGTRSIWKSIHFILWINKIILISCGFWSYGFNLIDNDKNSSMQVLWKNCWKGIKGIIKGILLYLYRFNV